MIRTATLTLLALAGSVILSLGEWVPPLAAVHLAFAAGIVPLIFAAMMHFVPVLTRSGDPSPRLAWLPAGAQGAGVIVFGAMAGMIPWPLIYLAAALDLFLAGLLLAWVVHRARRTLGTPHPGWRWYAAALACLMLALGGVLLMALDPGHRAGLRSFHLHLNTLGLVGLAALGTLPVLLPTALGLPDPDAARWLRSRFWWAAGGAILGAVGTGMAWVLAVPGSGLLLWVVLDLLRHWAARFGRRLVEDGVAASLLTALAGLAAMLLTGVLHGAGVIAAQSTLGAWMVIFLLPLVTGALAQLLPVWRFPGRVTPARGVWRAALAGQGRVRVGLFALAAGAFLAGQPMLGGGLAAGALLFFAGAVLRAWRSTR